MIHTWNERKKSLLIKFIEYELISNTNWNFLIKREETQTLHIQLNFIEKIYYPRFKWCKWIVFAFAQLIFICQSFTKCPACIAMERSQWSISKLSKMSFNKNFPCYLEKALALSLSQMLTQCETFCFVRGQKKKSVSKANKAALLWQPKANWNYDMTHWRFQIQTPSHVEKMEQKIFQ